MKAYVVTTGAIFGMLTVAHLWRMVEEGSHVATNPSFVLITALSAAMGVWAWRVFRLTTRT
jgi:hypothetical protein